MAQAQKQQARGVAALGNRPTLATWRCRGCRKTAAETTPRFSPATGLPLVRCDACAREQGRLAGVRQRRRQRVAYGRDPEPANGYTFTRAELAAKYREHAAECERRAQVCERNGDPDTAYRLRDQAADWLALAKHPYGR